MRWIIAGFVLVFVTGSGLLRSLERCRLTWSASRKGPMAARSGLRREACCRMIAASGYLILLLAALMWVALATLWYFISLEFLECLR